jgi:hypothetical protein
VGAENAEIFATIGRLLFLPNFARDKTGERVQSFLLFYNFTFSDFVETATAKTQLGMLPDTLHGQPFGASFSIL